MFSDNVNSGATIRFPSTANLDINSYDRQNPNETSTNFIITKNENILSGYFRRLGVVEVVLDYAINNISRANNNSTFTVNVSGVQKSITILAGNYTVADVLYLIADDLTSAYSGSPVFSVAQSNTNSGQYGLEATSPFYIVETDLANQLDFHTGSDNVDIFQVLGAPYLLPGKLEYIDFTSPNLTYQQGLKDSSTSKITRDILYRWYMAWDGPPPLDSLGYPIQQGYIPFKQRRYLSFPKQIKWDTKQPIGQLGFQVYDSDGDILNYDDAFENFEWSMNLLISEQ